jgi:HSP20 family molecular chaperone IbpA
MSTAATGAKQGSIAEMPNVVSGGNKDALLEQFRSSVAKRAYKLFEELGRVDGNDVSHWLRAEEEVCMRLPEVQQSGSWFTVSAPLVGVPADQIKVSVEQDGALIAAEKNEETADSTAHESMFYAVRWPESVSPETASAYLKNGTLTLVARKAGANPATGESAPEIPATEKPRSASRRAKR